MVDGTKTVSSGEIVVLLWRIKERSNTSLNHLYSSADWDQRQLNQPRDKGLTLTKGHSPTALHAPLTIPMAVVIHFA